MQNNKIFIREDFRRDGLCMNFLVNENLMDLVAKSFPGSIINIGYPAVCSEERKMCEKITEKLSRNNIETAVVGHALPSHLEIMSQIANSAKNTSANFWIPFSDYMIGQTMKKEPKEILGHAKHMAEIWASSSNRPLDVALVDSTSGEEGLRERIKEFYYELKDSGVRSIIACDTKGKATTKRLTDLLIDFRETNANLEYHPHNDNGLALKNIETVVSLGVRGIGTGIFGHGERGTMVDPRDMVAKYNIPYNPKQFSEFKKNYKELISSLNERLPTFTKGTIVTGTQYRLKGRNPDLETKFGVTSDKHILAKTIGIESLEIQDNVLEMIKNDLYRERKRILLREELKEKYWRYNGNQ